MLQYIYHAINTMTDAAVLNIYSGLFLQEYFNEDTTEYVIIDLEFFTSI